MQLMKMHSELVTRPPKAYAMSRTPKNPEPPNLDNLPEV